MLMNKWMGEETNFLQANLSLGYSLHLRLSFFFFFWKKLMVISQGWGLTAQLPNGSCPHCPVGDSVLTSGGNSFTHCLTRGAFCLLWDSELLVSPPDPLVTCCPWDSPYLCKFSVIRAWGNPCAWGGPILLPAKNPDEAVANGEKLAAGD